MGEDGQWYEEEEDEDEWMYDSDDEQPQNLMEKYADWWKKKKENRKHPTLKYMQKRAEMLTNNAKLDKLDYRAKEKRRRKRKLRKEIQQKRNRLHKEEVARLDKERRDREVSKRTHDTHEMKFRMNLFEKWGIENADRKAKRDEENRKKEEKRKKKEEKDRKKKEKDDKEAEDERLRLEGLKLTQDTLSMMRRAGVIAGANPPEPVEEDPQRETDTIVTLIERPPTPEQVDDYGNAIVKKRKKKKKGSRRQFFTVDLKRFRNVEEMKGDGIGEKGGVALGREMVSGVCPRLTKLDLSYNGLKFKGTKSIFDAFSRGCGTGITALDLRCNSIDARGIQGFRSAMETGALPKMVHVDLRMNTFGDDGGKLIAHMVLSGVLGNLETIRLDSCQMRDAGMSAVFKAFNAKSIGFLMPKLKLASFKNNHPSTALVKQWGIIPPHIMF